MHSQVPQNDGGGDEEARRRKGEEYEKLRENQIKKNRERFEELNIGGLAKDLRKSGERQKKQTKRKEKVHEEGGDENISDDHSEEERGNVTVITSKVYK